MLALPEIDDDELVRDFLLLENRGDETGAGRLGVTVEFDDHDGRGM